ncbi:hypothetical protein ACRYCC_09465 [Actinomadura scrupuli]|uniref:hypothetical protein n=1 Tax=Actinomadura scrupuli TaxID=559629 RepID=UPI003D99AE54
MTHDPGEADETAEPPHHQVEPPRDQASQHETEALRYERERQERIDRRNAVSWKIVGWVAAASLSLLAYDSGRLALEAHRDDRPWRYPACVAAVCVLLLLALLGHVLRRRRRGAGLNPQDEPAP